MSTYTLNNFTDIMLNGFEYSIPDQTIQLIMALSSQVGSPEYIKTPTWTKNNNPNIARATSNEDSRPTNRNMANKKRRGNRGMEVDGEDDWESLRSFHVTKIEKKEGLAGQIDQIKLILNKLTDKTFIDMRVKLIALIGELTEQGEETMLHVGNVVFDILSSNKFYSKLYCDLYCNLIEQFNVFFIVAQTKHDSYLKMFEVIQYADPDVDYDKFCENNKLNEKRRSLSEFLLNLTRNNILTNTQLVGTLFELTSSLMRMLNEDNKKNEVEELTENISILLDKELLTNYYSSNEDNEEYYIDDDNIIEVLQTLAKSKTKDFKSMSNKVLFKFMDLFDM